MSTIQQALEQAGLVKVNSVKTSLVNNSASFPDTKKKKYKYRNLPCSIVPDDKLWLVGGIDKNTKTSGVLEWCYDEKDALYIKTKMQEAGHFDMLNHVSFKDSFYSA